MSPTIDDAHLLTAWQQRHDAEAFRALCGRHAGLIEAVCRRQGSPDVAEAAQAVFLTLARRAGSVSGTCLGGWLTTTAQRVVIDQHRRLARRRRHEQEAAVAQDQQRAAAGAEPSWDEARQHLDAALASLSAGRREAILRFYLEGRPQVEVAAELGCSVDAVKTRVKEGLEGLRVFFSRKGIALGAAALASGLASEASASDPALVTTCVQTVLTPATAPGAAALANGVITAMIIKTTILAAAGLVLACSCLTAALVVGAESSSTLGGSTAAGAVPKPAVKEASNSVPPAASTTGIVCSPAWRNDLAVRDLARSGVCVYSLGGWQLSGGSRGWATPTELRRKVMPARDYVEAWAVERGQKPLWLREGKAAILEGGAAEERIRGLKKDLASPDAATRRQAAERAGTIHAVDALRLAIGAAGDTDQTVAQAAQASIGRLGWGAALELDEKAWTLVEKEIADAEAIGPVADRVDKMGPLVTEIALAGRQRPDRALPMLQKALTKQMGKPGATAIITALGLLPGEEAQQELEAVLRNGNPFEREEAICAMLASTPDKTLATLENEFSAWEKELSGSFKGVMKTHPSNALTVAKSLLAMAGALGNEKAKVFLKTTLKQTERADLRLAAAAALCAAGDNEGLAFVKGTLRGNGPTQDKAARNIYESLGSHGGVEALQLLKEALWAEGSKMDPQSAGMALGRNGSGEALGILREALQNGNPAIASRAGWGLEFVAGKPGLELATIALTHPDPIVRRTGAYSLGRTNGEKALPLLERALADRDVQVRTTAVYSLKRIGGEPALALIAKALKDPDANVRQAAADGASQVQSNSNF